MRFFLSVILISILAAIAEYFLPWWSIALVAFFVSLLTILTPGRAFLMGFLGIALCWLVAALVSDFANDHILSNRMASLFFHFPLGYLFIAVSAFVGGLVGGVAAWSAALLRGRYRRELIPVE
jgi:hypothetical protein